MNWRLRRMTKIAQHFSAGFLVVKRKNPGRDERFLLCRPWRDFSVFLGGFPAMNGWAIFGVGPARSKIDHQSSPPPYPITSTVMIEGISPCVTAAD